ncbi:MAG TPA: hypothetical protein VKB69_13115 [Micromonosporaceae bacterium]|nr:hypothetical protein [Micromonosporaceae bacterium]
MSKTTPAGIGDIEVWIYDASLSLLLAQLISVVESMPAGQRPAWWPDVVHDLRVHAAISDLYFDIGRGLDDRSRQQLAELYDKAANGVQARGLFTRDEADTWLIYDDLPVIFRGSQPVDTTPAAQLGHALAAIIRGNLSATPPGQTWFYGTPDGPSTIATRQRPEGRNAAS